VASFCKHGNEPSSSIKKGKVVPVLNYALRYEEVWGSGCIDPRILDLGTSWR
jgi:hypothetical protein